MTPDISIGRIISVLLILIRWKTDFFSFVFFPFISLIIEGKSRARLLTGLYDSALSCKTYCKQAHIQFDFIHRRFMLEIMGCCSGQKCNFVVNHRFTSGKFQIEDTSDQSVMRNVLAVWQRKKSWELQKKVTSYQVVTHWFYTESLSFFFFSRKICLNYTEIDPLLNSHCDNNFNIYALIPLLSGCWSIFAYVAFIYSFCRCFESSVVVSFIWHLLKNPGLIEETLW